MTKARLRYEIPVLVGLNGENVVAAVCNPNGYAVTDWCNDGSCTSYVLCNAGNRTQACLNGPDACDKSSNCYATCQTGDSVELPYTYSYYCQTGSSASQLCNDGSRASNDCYAVGGYYASCS